MNTAKPVAYTVRIGLRLLGAYILVWRGQPIRTLEWNSSVPMGWRHGRARLRTYMVWRHYRYYVIIGYSIYDPMVTEIPRLQRVVSDSTAIMSAESSCHYILIEGIET